MAGNGGGGDGIRSRSGRADSNWSSGQDYWEGEGRDDDAGGDEVGELPAGVAGTVLTVSPGQHAGDGAEEIEDDHREGIPVAATAFA